MGNQAACLRPYHDLDDDAVGVEARVLRVVGDVQPVLEGRRLALELVAPPVSSTHC